MSVRLPDRHNSVAPEFSGKPSRPLRPLEELVDGADHLEPHSAGLRLYPDQPVPEHKIGRVVEQIHAQSDMLGHEPLNLAIATVVP